MYHWNLRWKRKLNLRPLLVRCGAEAEGGQRGIGDDNDETAALEEEEKEEEEAAAATG